MSVFADEDTMWQMPRPRQHFLGLVPKFEEILTMKNDDGSGDAPFSVRGLGTAEAAKYLGISASYLEKARVNLTELPGPSFKKIGRRVIYLRESLDAYLNNPPTK